MAMREALPDRPISTGHASSNTSGGRRFMWRRRVAALVLGAASVLGASATAQETKSFVAPPSGGETVVEGYAGSYALVVGMSDYAQGTGWADLESVPEEVEGVERALRAQGFEVVIHRDPDAQGLKRAFDDFIGSYGYDEDHRLLFYVSGHGYTLNNGRHGYLVPTDAPNPSNEREFRRKALSMTQIMAWARDMSAKHALFLFDSCFSGTIFKTKSLMPGAPPHIDRLAAKPVRQFITAGSAGEEVPARSTFTPAFVDALEHGRGDLNGDGYVTGMELGIHLQATVPQYVKQTPQFGKIQEYELAQGDFVFRVNDDPVRDTLTVTTEPPDAQVHVVMNGRNVRARPGMEIEPGSYLIEVKARNHDTFQQYLAVSGDTRYEISLCSLRERKERVCEDKEVVCHRTETRRTVRSVEGYESSSLWEFESVEYDNYERTFRQQRRRIRQYLCDSAYTRLSREIESECSDIDGSYVNGSLTEDNLDCDCEIEGDYYEDQCTVTATWQCRPASCIKFRLIHAFTARNTGLSGRSNVWLMFTASEDKPHAVFLNLVQNHTESVVKRM